MMNADIIKSNKHILIIEDEEDIREMIAYNLEKESYTVSQAETGEEGFQIMLQKRPDLVLLDLMLPGVDGLDICKRIRNHEQLGDTRVIMLTAKGEESDIVTGLELGADDYITKPFSPKVLLSRIKSLLRREMIPEQSEKKLLRIFDLSIDPQKQEVLFKNQKIELTSSEFKALYFLAGHPGWVYTRYQIVDAVHGQDHPITERAVDVMMVSLRKKLGDAAEYIQTVRGVGYRFKE